MKSMYALTKRIVPCLYDHISDCVYIGGAIKQIYTVFFDRLKFSPILTCMQNLVQNQIMFRGALLSRLMQYFNRIEYVI